MVLNRTRWMVQGLALGWAWFGLSWLLRDDPWRYFYGFSGLAYALVLFGLAHFIARGSLWAWRGAVGLIGISIAATIFDQVGWIDLLFALAATAVLIMLISNKAAYRLR